MCAPIPMFKLFTIDGSSHKYMYLVLALYKSTLFLITIRVREYFFSEPPPLHSNQS